MLYSKFPKLNNPNSEEIHHLWILWTPNIHWKISQWFFNQKEFGSGSWELFFQRKLFKRFMSCFSVLTSNFQYCTLVWTWPIVPLSRPIQFLASLNPSLLMKKTREFMSIVNHVEFVPKRSKTTPMQKYFWFTLM